MVGSLLDQHKKKLGSFPEERIIAFAFMKPQSAMFEKLSKHGNSWDFRTGQTWDVFFPGYYVSWDHSTEQKSLAQPIGSDFTQAWYFDEESYRLFVDQVEQHCKDAGREWTWSGSPSLLFLRATVSGTDVIFDWRHHAELELHQLSTEPAYEAEDRLVERITKQLESSPENPLIEAYEIIQDETAAPLTYQGAFGLIAAVAAVLALFDL